jgi:PilZ domain
MSWIYIIASVLWGAAAVSIVAWYLVRAARRHRIVDERRSFPRPKLNFLASLKLQKRDGTSATIQVRGSNLTRHGAKVMSRFLLPPGSVVFIDLSTYHLMGVGHVVHCTAQGLKYSIGMEFKSPLMRSYEGTWALSVVKQPPAEPVAQTPVASMPAS